MAFVMLFHPDQAVATGAAPLVLAMTAWGVWKHRRIAPRNPTLQSQPAT
jgi:hypothetical protein